MEALLLILVAFSGFALGMAIGIAITEEDDQ